MAFFAATALTGAASAADLYQPPAEPAYAPPAEAWSWTGAYFGGHVGYGWARFDGIFDNSELPDFPEDATYASDLEARGFVAGAQAGYNMQSGAMVYGVEADVSFTGISDDVGDDDGDDRIAADIDVLASLRARVGVASGHVLGYVTGGLAYAAGTFTVTDDLDDVSENSGSTRMDTFGGVVGGGVEVGVGRNASVRLEGLYYVFGREIDTSGLTDDSDDGDFLALQSVGVIRAAVNFRL
jgi:outer membrane immunogenic protein